MNGDFLEDLNANSARHTLSETLNTRKSAGGFLSQTMQKEIAARLSQKQPVGLVSCNFDHLNVLSTVAVTDCGKIRLNLLQSCAST